ncbi:MAG: hypothetical protein J6W76_02395 [Spirochaetales bacterium]|nr:hypothetical protein [Spirochaetales bacterium]
MSKALTEIIIKQTKTLLENIENQIIGADLSCMVDNVNNSRYLFHAIHSLDKYFINPYQYEYEAGKIIDIDEDYSIISEKRAGYQAMVGFVIPREKLQRYFDFVKTKIENYLANLTDEELVQNPPNCPYTRFDLILAQFRHSMFHAGMSEVVTFHTNGQWLEYKGLPYVGR